jgi:type I restriction enzyme, S subunit
MSSSWPTLTLGDVCVKITDGAHNSPKSVVDGKPMASVKDLTRFGVDLSSARLIPHEDFDRLVIQGCQPDVGDVLIAKDGNSALDTVCTVDDPLDAVLLSSVAILRPNKNKLDPDFLKYYFCSASVIDYLKNNFISGAAIPRVVLKDFRKAEINVPPLETQKNISKVLLSLDDKIELNTQTNQTLEQIAQAIFKSWFVDFEPVKAKIAVLEAGGNAEQAELAAMSVISAKDEIALKQLQANQPEDYAELAQNAALFPSAMEDSEHGELPNGWIYEPVINSAEFINGAAYKNMHFSKDSDAKPVIKIAELKNGITDNTKFTNTELGDKFKLDARDILFSWSGSPETSIDTFIWTDGKAWLNQHIFKVVNKTEEERCFTYWLLKFLKPIFIEIAKNKQTTGLGHVTRKDMERLHFCKPNEDVVNLFYKSAGPILGKIENDLIENNTLAESRDELLPKLLSGDLPIASTEVA